MSFLSLLFYVLLSSMDYVNFMASLQTQFMIRTYKVDLEPLDIC
jgi:hypothetical protein